MSESEDGNWMRNSYPQFLSHDPLFVEELGFMDDSVNIQSDIIKNNIVSFFPNAPNNEDVFLNEVFVNLQIGESV